MNTEPAAVRAPRSRLYVATSNAGKMREMDALLRGTRFEAVTFEGYVSPVEGDRSYVDNAALKARALRAALGAAGLQSDVLADDSGLEVRALDGRPGVLTADYGGRGAGWPQRRRKLLDELAATGTADRHARFICALHFIAADGRESGAFGTVEGNIATAERGELGFSFDPIFEYAPACRTFAELSEHEKNTVSHRAVATAALIAALDAGARRLPTPSARGDRAVERE